MAWTRQWQPRSRRGVCGSKAAGWQQVGSGERGPGVGEAISQCCSEQLGVGRAASEAGREAEGRPCGGAEFHSGHGKLAPGTSRRCRPAALPRWVLAGDGSLGGVPPTSLAAEALEESEISQGESADG